MEDARRRELEALLRSHLAEQRDEGISRLLWLAEQLENYVERWIGIEAMASPLPSQLVGDLFGMVEIGARLTAEEIRRAHRPPAVEGAWDEFAEVLSGMGTGAGSRPAELREPLSWFRATLS